MKEIRVKFDNDNESTYQVADGVSIETTVEKMLVVNNGRKSLFINLQRVLWFELCELEVTE